MKKSGNGYQVIIVGGGPVGLFLGCCLHRMGISFQVLEKRKERVAHSRSLGIHPVSLELFQQLGIVGPFLQKGIKIKRGLAFSDSRKIGEISFEHLPGPFDYILALPQFVTENILETHLESLNPDALLRNTEVLDIETNKDLVTITFVHSGTTHTVTADFLAGCDGKNSTVRARAAVPFEGDSYPDTYIMGDFSDNTNFGNDAAIFLPKEGLIESFPLAQKKRRWVVKTASYVGNPDRKIIENQLMRRIGHDLSGEENYMLSSFGVQKLLAKPMARGRLALAGDAAHVVSPIGGQGMNLGWLDAWDLAETLNRCLNSTSDNRKNELRDYGRRRLDIAVKAIRRAEMNMRLGRATSIPKLRNVLVWLMLNTPLEKRMARLFTMRNLDGRFF